MSHFLPPPKEILAMRIPATVLSALAATLALAAVQPASAQFAQAEDAIKYRQSAFTVMSNQMGRLAAMARGNAPYDAASAQASARAVEMLSHLPWDAFPAGSSGGAAKIKGDPWKEAEQFGKLQAALKSQTAKLAASAGTLEGLRAQVGPTSQACRDCHEKYRQVC
jgi:cytochrome c556